MNEPTVEILNGHVIDVLRELPDGIVQTVVTSPPYWGLRDYSRCSCTVHVQDGHGGSIPGDSGSIIYGQPDPACPKCRGTGRDQSLDVMWDEDPACAHEWTEETLAKVRRQATAPEPNGALRTKTENVDEQGRGPAQTITARSLSCSRCGAWKGQLGLEPRPEMYVAHLVQVFREVRRVLRDDGTVWLNLGDCYFGDSAVRAASAEAFSESWDGSQTRSRGGNRRSAASEDGIKPKDLVGIPWAVAFALRKDGWWLRSDPIWAKPNPMPESLDGWRWERHMLDETVEKAGGGTKRVRVREPVTVRYMDVSGAMVEAKVSVTDVPCPGCPVCAPNDGLVLRRDSWRPTKAHEYVFFLAKSETYFADADAVREAVSETTHDRARPTMLIDAPAAQVPTPKHAVAEQENRAKAGFGHDTGWTGADQAGYLIRGRNLRTVWSITTEAYPEAHFATFPTKLVEPCVKASTSEAGCCAVCGAPWARVVLRSVADPRPTKYDEEYSDATGGRSRSRSPSDFFSQAISTTRKAAGFKRTCDHDGDPVPCVVLDPFGGSGTVGQVARALRRSAILIEIKEDYVRLAADRVNVAQRTMDDFAER